MTSVVVYGPAGCGKSQHADDLARLFGCLSVNHEWADEQPVLPTTLNLTNVHPPFAHAGAAEIVIPWRIAAHLLAVSHCKAAASLWA